MTATQRALLDLKKLFPFELDDFQLQAIAALDANQSVVVCAPTGSGKTLIGEYAIYRALATGRRVFYTTPLKALSNQKLRDFREQFGYDRVGLLTGDVAINRDAPILVMTTEIFRNMLYGTPIGEVGTSLTDLETVVLDECHYMNDRQRGTVWEESIIYCSPQIQLVALSATVANSAQLTDWISQVHGETRLIYSDFRPVPLQFHFGNPKGLFPLLDETQKRMNPRLKPSAKKSGPRRQDSPTLEATISQLRQRDMLPAIYFIFSRRGCDRALAELMDRSLYLVDEDEATQIKNFVTEFLSRYPEVARANQIEALYRGIAVHHAGVLPAWKALVEELFQKSLIKVVFATETLAAGINMPARTTVISTLSKRTDQGHRLLNPSEFLQMAGRAGRRGMDAEGHVVTLQTPFEGVREAAYLATAGADPLVSQFAPGYGMVLNLLQTHSLQEARALTERSFGHYLATLHLEPQRQAIANLEVELSQRLKKLADVDTRQLAHYEKVQQRLKEERRLLKTLQQQAWDLRDNDLALALKFTIPGTVLTLKVKQTEGDQPLPAILVSKVQSSGQFPNLLCLGKDNFWYVLTVGDVANLHAEYPRLAAADTLQPPIEMPLKPGQRRSGGEQTLSLTRQIPQPPSMFDTHPEVYEQWQRVNACEQQLLNHPARQWGDTAALLKQQRRIADLQDEIADRRQKLEQQSQRHWQEFLSLIEILLQFNCLEVISRDADGQPLQLRITDLGRSAAAMRGENELWLGLACYSGKLDHLEPHQLATACAALVTEASRPDSWVRGRVSDAVEEALESLRGVRRQLFKLQHRYQIALPIWMEYELVSLVEHWAMGSSWSDLAEKTNLDDGDIVRILRRTLDLLYQIPYVPHLSPQLKDHAQAAIELINRFPVSDLLE